MKQLGIRLWRFLKPILIADLIIAITVDLSFLWWGSFTIPAYSDRLSWAGIACIVAGLPVMLASLGSYRTLGTPSVITAPGDARIAHERIAEQLSMNSRRYLWFLYPATAGLLCIGVSAVVQVLGG